MKQDPTTKKLVDVSEPHDGALVFINCVTRVFNMVIFNSPEEGPTVALQLSGLARLKFAVSVLQDGTP